jgi:hypothetical protein
MAEIPHEAVWSPRKGIEVCFNDDEPWPCRVEQSKAMNSYAMSPIREEPMKLGTVVVYGKHASNGADEHPAIVTRVWGEGETPTVNIKVIPDGGDPFDVTSVTHWKSQSWGSSYYYREP